MLCGSFRERRSKVVPYPGRDRGVLAGCSALAFPASAARGESQPTACVASLGSRGFGSVICCNVPLMFAFRAGSL